MKHENFKNLHFKDFLRLFTPNYFFFHFCNYKKNAIMMVLNILGFNYGGKIVVNLGCYTLSFNGQIVHLVYSLLDVITYITYRVATFFQAKWIFKAFPMLWVSDSRTYIQSYIDYREASLSKKIISM